jgi:hypothetical protein
MGDEVSDEDVDVWRCVGGELSLAELCRDAGPASA